MKDRNFLLLFLYTTVVLILMLAPRQVTRRIRRIFARLVMIQWSKMSLLSAIIYNFFWQNGNGNGHH